MLLHTDLKWNSFPKEILFLRDVWAKKDESRENDFDKKEVGQRNDVLFLRVPPHSLL